VFLGTSRREKEVKSGERVEKKSHPILSSSSRLFVVFLCSSSSSFPPRTNHARQRGWQGQGKRKRETAREQLSEQFCSRETENDVDGVFRCSTLPSHSFSFLLFSDNENTNKSIKRAAPEEAEGQASRPRRRRPGLQGQAARGEEDVCCFFRRSSSVNGRFVSRPPL